jgi:Putative beta-barrel porin 2
MKKVIASAGLLALGALGTQSTQAQMVAGAEKPWSVSATLRGFYDDNYDTQPASSGLKKGSFGFELRPSAQLNLVTGQTTLNLSYIYSEKYFGARPNGHSDQSHDIEIFLNHNFNERYSVDFTDSFVIAQEPEIVDPSLAGVQRANGNNFRNTASINFHAQVTKLLGFVLGYSNSYYDYDQNAGNTDAPAFATRSALLDRVENNVRLDSRWVLTDTSTGILGYTFGAVNYLSKESIADNPAPGAAGYPFAGLNYVDPTTRNNYSHSIYVGLDHTFRSDLSFSGRAGVQILDYYNNPGGNPSGSVDPFADLSLNYTYMDSGVLVVGFRNAHNQTDLGASVTPGGPVVTLDEESSTVYANITQKLTPISPKLLGTLTAQYQHSTFNGGASNNGADDFYLVGLNLSYQFTRYLSSEIGYNYDLLQSDVANRTYTRNRVYIGVTASY